MRLPSGLRRTRDGRVDGDHSGADVVIGRLVRRACGAGIGRSRRRAGAGVTVTEAGVTWTFNVDGPID
jgi:hypothetical protein